MSRRSRRAINRSKGSPQQSRPSSVSSLRAQFRYPGTDISRLSPLRTPVAPLLKRAASLYHFGAFVPHTLITNRSPDRFSFWRSRNACESSVRVGALDALGRLESPSGTSRGCTYTEAGRARRSTIAAPVRDGCPHGSGTNSGTNLSETQRTSPHRRPARIGVCEHLEPSDRVRVPPAALFIYVVAASLGRRCCGRFTRSPRLPAEGRVGRSRVCGPPRSGLPARRSSPARTRSARTG